MSQKPPNMFDKGREYEQNLKDWGGLVGMVYGLIRAVLMVSGKFPDALCSYRMGLFQTAVHWLLLFLLTFIAPLFYLENDAWSPGLVPVTLFLLLYVLHVAAITIEAIVRKLRRKHPPIHTADIGVPWPWWRGLALVLVRTPGFRWVVIQPLTLILVWFPLGFIGVHLLIGWITGVDAWWIQGLVLGVPHLLLRLQVLLTLKGKQREIRDRKIEAEHMQVMEQ